MGCPAGDWRRLSWVDREIWGLVSCGLGEKEENCWVQLGTGLFILIPLKNRRPKSNSLSPRVSHPRPAPPPLGVPTGLRQRPGEGEAWAAPSSFLPSPAETGPPPKRAPPSFLRPGVLLTEARVTLGLGCPCLVLAAPSSQKSSVDPRT